MPAYDPPSPERPTVKGVPETMVVVISDVHVGKLVEPEWVGEGFAYNSSVFHERLDRLKRSLLEIRAIHEKAYPIPRLKVLLLGDLVDGVDMRRGHHARVDLHAATKQVLVLVSALSEFLAEMGTVFEQVDVYSVPGNHGRVGDFGVNLVMDNWDFMASKMLEVTLQNAPNINFRVRTQKHDLIKLGPLTTYIAHGDGIKGGGGFAGLPVYGITRAAAKDIGLHKQIIDLYIIGHFHQAHQLSFGPSTLLLNGCWDGGDDFSVNQLKLASDPSQWVFGVHPKRGLTWQYRIQVADAVRLPTPVYEGAADE